MDKFNQMEPKQKVMLVATVIMFAILGYLVYTTFFPATSRPAASTVKTPTSVSMPTPRPANSLQAMQPRKIEKSGVKPTVMDRMSEADEALLQRSKEVEQQYVTLVTQYQLAQLQQKLAQTNAQIAQSRLSTVKAMSEAKKLDAKVTGTSLGAPSVQNKNVEIIKAMYVGYSHGRWMAMLNLDGSYYQVHIGTRLPTGSVVSSISNRGVVLRHNGERYYLAVPTPLDEPAKPAAKR